MVIKAERLEILQRAFGRLEYEQKWMAEVQETSGWRNTKKTYGVNWSCAGVQPPEVVFGMMMQLKIAKEIAEMLNRMNIEVDKTDDDMVDTADTYNTWIKKMMDSITIGEYDKRKDFLRK
jgi:hypothetical protein